MSESTVSDSTVSDSTATDLEWHRILAPDELDEGRVTTVTVGRRSFAVSHLDGRFGCIDNACPHQGGPLGEGSIEKGWLRCPWHGYDYSPIDGTPPGGFSDGVECFPTEVRDDGVWVGLPRPAKTEPRTMGDVLIETFVAWGLSHVFGMVGHSNLGLADAMRKAEQRDDLTYIGIRHEGAAAFAASAFGKLTGRPAACFGIAGPGSTNLLTGLYDAKEDRAPVLALCGQVPSKVKGRGAFQDTNLEGAFADVSAFSETLHADSDVAELASLAMKTAIVERNVANLIVPDELQHRPVSDDTEAGSPTGRLGGFAHKPSETQLDAANDLIEQSERPLIVVGNGARPHKAHVVALAEALGAPVATTFKAKGLIGDDHELACGVLGRSGTPVASWMMNESDLIIVLGASFANHTGIATYKPLIQVDNDPMAIGRFHSVDAPVLGDIGITAQLLAHNAATVGRQPSDLRSDLAERWAIWTEEKAGRRTDDHGNGLNAAVVMDVLGRQIAADAVICVDVGNNTYSFGRYFEASGSQDLLMSGYLGSIGFALPAALGAWAAVGGSRQVVSISGDGGFGQYAMEFTTAVKYGMNLTHVLLHNGELGKISKEQRAGEWEVWQTSLHNPNFAQFAELCGGRGFRVTHAADLEAVVAEALAHDGPALVEIMTDPLLV